MLALAAVSLSPPVPGAVERPFAYAGDPFSRGHHRGVDLAASPGATVRAACSGRVAFAGRAGANGRAVTIRCGRWSVTHLPLHDVAVRAGERIAARTPIGTAGRARGHAGLHLGVRRTADPFGYVDPAPLLREPARRAPPVAPRATARRLDPPPPHPAPLPRAPAARAAPVPHAAAGSSPPLAPWPAWAGLALLLSGAVGTRTVRARRARRAAPARPRAAPVR